jgi:HEXXH motif-containing protein
MADTIPLIRRLSDIETASEETARALSVEYGRAVTARLSRLAKAEEIALPDFASDGDSILRGAGTGAWMPEIGRANTLARRGRESLPLAAAQMALALMSLGLEGRYTMTLNYPDMLFFKGRWVPCGDETILSHADGCLEMQSGLETYILADGDGQADLDATIRQGFSDSCLYVWGYCVDPAILKAQDNTLNDERVGSACHSLDAAAELVAAMGVDARAWIERLIRQVSIVDSIGLKRNQTSSRSNASRPGNIAVSAPSDSLHLAELLVHEAAHQHFHLGALLEPYTRPEADGKLYYSSLIGRKRPLKLVALAAHAVGNMYIFLDRVASSDGEHRDGAADRIRELGETAQSLIGQVRTQRALFTPAGGAMLFDLMEKTQAIHARYCGATSPEISAAALEAEAM